MNRMRTIPAQRSRGRSRLQVATRCAAGVGLLTCLALAVWTAGGCRSTQPEDKASESVTVELDVIPIILAADTSETASVWVTVKENGMPAADSTRVRLVATVGTVPDEVLTLDGLAVASYRPSRDTGVATIIAQAKGVRDTMNITLY